MIKMETRKELIMGEMLIYKCPHCGNKYKLNYGFGYMWHSFEKDMFYPRTNELKFNIYDELDETTLEKVHKFIEESEDVLITNVEYKPYICKECGKIESKNYFNITSLPSGKVFRPKYKCECGGNFRKLTSKEEEHIFCHKCGAEMTRTDEIMWD